MATLDDRVPSHPQVYLRANELAQEVMVRITKSGDVSVVPRPTRWEKEASSRKFWPPRHMLHDIHDTKCVHDCNMHTYLEYIMALARITRSSHQLSLEALCDAFHSS